MAFGADPKLFHSPLFPAFKDLRSLDLRRLGGNLSKLSCDIAVFLIGSPHLKFLGLELKAGTANVLNTETSSSMSSSISSFCDKKMELLLFDWKYRN